MASHSNVLLTIHPKNEKAEEVALQAGFKLDLSIAMGVVEFDDMGRRAFVYQRADDSFALYADKQINIEI